MRAFARLSMFLAALAFSGCAAEAGTDGVNGEDDFVASEAEALKASDVYKALVGSYTSKTAVQRFTLNADLTFTLDTGARCITAPCDVASDAGRWSLWSYRGRIYLNLEGKASRWYLVHSYSTGVLVGMNDKGTWTKQPKVEEPTSGCAAMLCAPGTICMDDGSGAKCVAYACPKESFINCMPVVPAERQNLCSGDYHEWIKANCLQTEFVY